MLNIKNWIIILIVNNKTITNTMYIIVIQNSKKNTKKFRKIISRESQMKCRKAKKPPSFVLSLKSNIVLLI